VHPAPKKRERKAQQEQGYGNQKPGIQNQLPVTYTVIYKKLQINCFPSDTTEAVDEESDMDLSEPGNKS